MNAIQMKLCVGVSYQGIEVKNAMRDDNRPEATCLCEPKSEYKPQRYNADDRKSALIEMICESNANANIYGK